MPPKLRYTNLLKKSLPKVKPKDLIKEWKIFVGDTVQVVSGRKDVGKQGKVLEVLKNENRLIVEGVMLAKKNMKPNPEAPKGSQFLTEMAISYESVRLVDPVLNQPTLVKLLKMPNPITGRSQTTRLSALSGQLIPIPEKKDPFKDKKAGTIPTD
ncbi:Plastid ribosomal protein L24 [Quaeritorhiza haematococci]|nr:Plastid ribosomal protein L24 [Quaeritorhiza haematococci]